MTTTMPQVPDTILASIHQDAINRVSEFFNATTRDILNELLQNARRSGATRVDITTQPDSVTITDDGHGITDPRALLAFGQTTWESEAATNEHPAGMGLYALARRERVRIRSKAPGAPPWQVDLTPDHFVGNLPAPITLLDPGAVPQGTSITFSCDTTPNIQFQDAARHYPLPVWLNGAPLEQEDFLQRAFYTEEWQGTRIGVTPRMRYQANQLNFHGILVMEANLPHVRAIESTWTANVDVRDCPQLQLTLPARRQVIETPFMNQLRRQCRAVIYRAMLQNDTPVDVPKNAQDDAASLGVLLPDASPALARWSPSTANYNHSPDTDSRQPLPTDAIVLDLTQEPPDQQALARAAETNGLMDRLFAADIRLKGYPWYDHATKAGDPRITILTQEHGEQDLQKIRETQKEPDDARPQAITLYLRTTTAGDQPSSRVISLPTDAVFWEAEPYNSDEVRPLLAQDATITVSELSELMMDALFSYSEDHEDDSLVTQQEYARDVFTRTAIMLLTSREEALRATIAQAVQRHIAHEIPPSTVATITVQRNRPIEITLKQTPQPD